MIEILSDSKLVLNDNPLVIFDRDDTLIENIENLNNPENIKWLSNRLPTLEKLTKIGIKIAIATNQSAIGRGKVTEKEYFQVTEELLQQMRKVEVKPFVILACPHNYDIVNKIPLCECRKPNSKMLKRIIELEGNRTKKRLFIGDSISDQGAAQNCEHEIDFIYSNKNGEFFENSILNWLRK